MALQWMVLSWVVAVEAAVAVLVSLPAPRLVKSRFVALVSLLLRPLAAVLPFAAFQLLDINWKNEHLLICPGDVCTMDERIRYEKSIFKAQRNVILCVLAYLLYWCIYRICKYNKEINKLEEVEKRLKDVLVFFGLLRAHWERLGCMCTVCFTSVHLPWKNKIHCALVDLDPVHQFEDLRITTR